MTRLDDELERLAAEHALGTLEGADAARAAALLDRDAAFAGAVERWRGQLGEIDETAPASAPGEALWRRIESGLSPRVSGKGRPTSVSSKKGAAAALWQSLPFWRAAGLAGAAASLLLAVGLGLSSLRQARAPVLIAVLLADANRPAAVVNAFRDGRAELIPLEAIYVPADRALEIWTLWDRARGPVSVGLIDRARTVRLNVEALPKPGPNQLFEITLEPRTGSPTGRPTGPILMKGTTSNPL